MRARPRALFGLSSLALVAALGLGACQGCHPSSPSKTTEDAAVAPPTLRLVLLSTVAGALEPCGCSKAQLGGVDHLGAFLAAERAKAPATLVLGAGPLFFQEPSLAGDGATQGLWKAEALASAAAQLHLTAWAPGANDWAAGAAKLEELRARSGAALLAANLESDRGIEGTRLVEAGGLRLGLIGLSQPGEEHQGYPDGVRSKSSSIEALRAGVTSLKAQGARVLVGLGALPRGEALRLADAVPELTLLLVGKSREAGDVNDSPKAPELVGRTLVVEAANHLQTVSVVDLYLREATGASSDPLSFVDGSGLERASEGASLGQRIRELEMRIGTWEKDDSVKASDLAARKSELLRLQQQKAQLDQPTTPPTSGNYFRVRSVEIRAELGDDPGVESTLREHYRRVNEHNKQALADRKPEPAPEGQASFVGVETCSACHPGPRQVWDGTAHSHAYATLQKDFKEYNLDCVGCHVTGYGKPGGSTVTWNEPLRNVGCEECHGPGSLHIKDPTRAGSITKKPDLRGCVAGCHHSPHVEGFDAAARVRGILGPGHGL